jgi:predicted kinase
MELVILMGLQATGKSTFCRERFYNSHVRINLDTLKTRHREHMLVEACLSSKTKFVVDNMNLTREDRARYIVPAKTAGFRITGYFFESKVGDAITRNAGRKGRERVPDIAIAGSSSRIKLPAYDEGFDELFYVRLDGSQFSVEKWKA